jgi:hypothetical protein
MQNLDEEAVVARAPRRVDNDIRFLDDAEAREQFNRQARRLLGISGEEFLRRHDAGEYASPKDDRELRAVMKLVMLSDLVR